VVTDAVLKVKLGDADPVRAAVPPLPPRGVRKVPFPIVGAAEDETGTATLTVRLERGGAELDAATLDLAVKAPQDNRRVTFTSRLDGSVQYFGHLPARGDQGAKALVLSLHGAAVEAINQSGSYAPLSWGHVVAPTNRRPFGFNWEDWGRLDALEVLDLARQTLDVAPDRIYLTGHSMGGHGSWHLASLYPGLFAAVGPSAGWISFWSYRPDRGGEPDSPLAELVMRATLPSRTLQTAPNLAGLGVYVLHGIDDQVVSVEEARTMRAHLAPFHRDLDWHEEPGAGHWWDRSDGPGADCVAWAPMLDYFVRHRRPATHEVRHLRFRTPDPAVSAWHRWACVAQQQRPFVMSTLDLQLDPLTGDCTGSTVNVATLGLDLAATGLDSARVDLDGHALSVAIPDDGVVWLAHGDQWRPIAGPDPAQKGPRRGDGFRTAFANRVQLVYATGGDPAENAWARARARLDAEHLWYQGNAALDVLPDSLYDPTADRDRNVILYGNADTHAHWAALWRSDAVAVSRDGVTVNDRVLPGDGLAVLAVRPRPGSDTASVGIVAGSGLAGCRLTDRRPALRPGIAYPDVMVFEDRGQATITRAAGFFDRDWSWRSGELIWADTP
jgi:poly(3-hydroxybutyrate) depolymerase